MTIALNLFLAGAVLIGIVAMLARSIMDDEKSNKVVTTTATPNPVEPATIRGARTRSHRGVASHSPVGAH